MTANRELRVEMIKCDAFGYCAELLPEIIELDEWGYPIVSGEVTADLLDEARRAVDACPMVALRIARRQGRPSRSAADGRRRSQ
ncbi:MAG TPA: ferredoxin [Gaiellaceae bacterium]|nr:ferredoxin [Gaiellaceae bacterium]